MSTVRVQVLFFGLLRDLMGTSRESLDLGESPTGGFQLRDVFAHYAQREPRLAGLAASIVLARNQSFEAPECAIADGDEIAFLPPVSGGTGPYTHVMEDPAGHFFALTRERIDTEALKRQMLLPQDGAMVDFEGVVRDNTKGRATLFLDYECYEGMAIKLMAQIGREIAAGHAISRIALVHRLGRLEIGEASVVVIATSPHRGPAFAAALDGINRLKKTVPIWKKEHFADGEVWVDGDWDDSVVTSAGSAP
ncbi:MAG: molybdenum cofactor biosynthesis protein MoaE [Bryobacteraceae bacterium]|nr:molybdenum cofactor biosynthesis protein MoaE [Bryobacteraceae bacterium]